MLRDQLTNEELRKKFKSQFELVNYSISLAENMIKSGRGPRIKTDTQNRALHVLDEIILGKDQFDEIAVEVEEMIIVEAPVRDETNGKRRGSEFGSKGSFQKKGRKILAE